MSLERVRIIFRSAYSKHLLATNIVASGGLLLLGDVIQQHIELYRGLHTKGGWTIFSDYSYVIVQDPMTGTEVGKCCWWGCSMGLPGIISMSILTDTSLAESSLALWRRFSLTRQLSLSSLTPPSSSASPSWSLKLQPRHGVDSRTSSSRCTSVTASCGPQSRWSTSPWSPSGSGCSLWMWWT